MLAGLVIALLLAGCSSGNAREAERGREAVASEEARLAEHQATYSASFVNPGTPTPAPTAAPAPTLDRLVLARSISGNGPSEELASVPANFGTVYAGALLNGLSRGTVVSAVWRGERGNVYTSETTIERDAAQAWVGLPLPLDGSLSPGRYAALVFVTLPGDDEAPRLLNSLVFEVTSTGSRARALSPGRAPRIVPNDGEADEGSSSETDSGEGGGRDGGRRDGGGGGQTPPPIVPVDEDD